MDHLSSQLSLIFSTIIFTSVIFMNLTKKGGFVVKLYIVQSAAVAALLISSSFEKFSPLLIIAIAATVAVKLIIGPYFFFKLLKRHQSTINTRTFLGVPFTLLAIAALTALTQAEFFKPLIYLTPSGQNLLSISVATILISLFLSINRKGALSQILGILSLENGIVSFAVFAGLEQNPELQLGITFSILIWVIIATAFVSMISRQFGSLDVSRMTGLTE